ncbi:hypothetical protein EV421DRAFT_1740100 [Armillaria borealis]|uniref:Uncharacterized protein n=1 Tax=Armillaria borealis TaxID=47425 RepID=A0AA39J3V2_9AGAR|nr:hypothetical protein EV421DRAFT_1740100 [Armillaria borealis]
MPQAENIWMKLASLVVASVNPGTLSYIVAFAVVVVVSLSTILLPFEPGSMVKTLNKTVEKTYIHYGEHKDKLDHSAGFEDKVNRLWVEAFKLKERRLQARNDTCLTDLRSWRRYMLEAKDIWAKVHQYQREIVELRKVLKLGPAGTNLRRPWGTTIKEGERRPGAKNLIEPLPFRGILSSYRIGNSANLQSFGKAPSPVIAVRYVA